MAQDQEINTGSPPAVPLGILLSYPFFWKTYKICHFLKKSHKLLRDRKDEAIIKNFQNGLDKKALEEKYMLWGSEGDWKSILDSKYPTHFDILKYRYTKSLNVNGDITYKKSRSNISKKQQSSVVSLLGLMRDKHEHSGDIPPEKKEVLGWFTGTGDLDDGLFANYWTNLFPELLSFLWIGFHQFKGCSEMAEFYPADLANFDMDLLEVEIVQILEQFKHSLLVHNEQGGLQGRYTAKKYPIGLEFHILPPDLTQMVLDGGSSVRMEVTTNQVSCRWNKITDGQLKDEQMCFRSSALDHGGPSLIFILGDVCRYVKSNETEFTSWDSEICTQIIIFTDQDDKRQEEFSLWLGRSLDVEFYQDPLHWDELSEKTKESIGEKGYFHIQGNDFRIKELLQLDSQGVSGRKRVLSKLNGRTLSTLLQLQNVHIFKRCEVPKIPDGYTERRLFHTARFGASVFTDTLGNYCFVVEGIERKDFLSLTKVNSETVSEFSFTDESLKNFQDIKLGTSKVTIFLVTDGGDFGQIVLEALKEVKRQKVHMMRYMHDGASFYSHCHTEIGNVVTFDDSLTTYAREAGLMKESELIESLKCNPNSRRLVYFPEKPGMGKSLILISLARQILHNGLGILTLYAHTNGIAEIFCEMSAEAGAEVALTREMLTRAIVNLFGTNEFEKSLIHFCLNDRIASGVEINIFFDGVDEVTNSRWRQVSIKAIAAFTEHFPSVRVLAAVREHLHENVCNATNFGCYKIEPFAHEEQIELIAQYWLQRCQDFHGNACHVMAPSKEALYVFAGKCLSINPTVGESSLTVIPLHCRFLAEIYEDHAISSNLHIAPDTNDSMIGMYAQLIERKLAIYVKEKCKLSMTSPVVNAFRNELERFHIYLALKLLFGDGIASEFHNLLLIRKSSVTEINSIVLEVGVVQQIHPLTFIHRSIAEYILALFVYNVLNDQFLHIDKNGPLFRKLLLGHVLSLSEDRLKNYPSGLKQPSLCQFLNAMCAELNKSDYGQCFSCHSDFDPSKRSNCPGFWVYYPWWSGECC